MTLGEKIYHLRLENNMPQGDLANALGVSRQSVSKWETNTSVPEVNKLVKMSELFNISLDELIRGVKPEEIKSEPKNSDMYVQKSGLPTRKIVGLIILGIGVIAFLFLSLLADTLFALIFSTPLFVCAVICLIVDSMVLLGTIYTNLCVPSICNRYSFLVDIPQVALQ